jgi:hypothetical protein
VVRVDANALHGSGDDLQIESSKNPVFSLFFAWTGYPAATRRAHEAVQPGQPDATLPGALVQARLK